MHLLQRLYRDAVLPIEIDRRAVTGIVPALRARPGFMGYMTADYGGGLFASYTAYADVAVSEAVLAAVPGVIRSSLSDLIPQAAEVSGGAVLLHHRGPGKAGIITVRSYAGCADPVELERRVATQLLPRFVAVPGFQGYVLVDGGQGRVMSINLFGALEDAEVLNAMAAPLVQRYLADLLPSPAETLVGQVLSEIQGC